MRTFEIAPNTIDALVETRSIRYRIADVAVQVRVPAEIVAHVTRMLARLPMLPRRGEQDDLVVAFESGEAKGRAQRLVETIARSLEDAAHRSRMLSLAGTALVRENVGLVLVGTNPLLAQAVSAQLAARRWSIVADRRVFIDVAKNRIDPMHVLRTVRSRDLNQYPARLRHAIEVAPWFVDADGNVCFYGVDPASSFGSSAWAPEGRVDRIVWLDDRTGPAVAMDVSALSLVDELQSVSCNGDRLLDFLLDASAVTAARVGAAFSREAGDAIERWVASSVV